MESVSTDLECCDEQRVTNSRKLSLTSILKAGFVGQILAAAAINHTQNTILVEETIRKAFNPYLPVDGMYFMQNSFWVFVSEK